MQEQIEKEITQVFQKLRDVRLPGMRELSKNILEEFRINLDRRLIAIGQALDHTAANQSDPAAMEKDKQRHESIGKLLNSQATLYLTNQ